MANYHLTTKSISRSSGKSCVASLAYRSATQLADQRTGETFDYTNKAFVDHVDIMIPENASQWIRIIAEECRTDKQSALQKLSDIFEKSEKRCNSRVYREIEFSLPRELTEEQNLEWAKAFIQKACLEKGMVAVLNFHNDIDEKTGKHKPHCHVLLSTRELTETGFSKHKQRDWNKQELLEEWRELCAQFQNEALAKYGHDVRVDHRSYEERGIIEILPQPKRGKAVSQMSTKGITTEKQSAFDLVKLKNQFQITKRPELVLSLITTNHSTFTNHDIARVLNRYIDNLEQHQALYQKILNSDELITLKAEKKWTVYTTRTLLEAELGIVKMGEDIAGQKTHPVQESLVFHVIEKQNKELEKHGGLSPDQVAAIQHILQSNRLSCVVGLAGAGKTTCLIAAYEAWEESGYRVVGLAPTGRAAENLSKLGIRSMTLHRFLLQQEKGREQISEKTVVILDEAGMVDSRRMAQFLSIINESGAKLVPLGDTHQLQAIEAGPAYRLLLEKNDPALLTTIVRQNADWQRLASSLFGTQQTAEALELYQQAGAIQLNDNPKETLILAWAKDIAAHPDQSHLMLAFTNKDVRELNESARVIMRAQGKLTGKDLKVLVQKAPKSSTEERFFAQGDRLLFLKNENGLSVKNGSLGTITAIKGNKIKVRLDDSGKEVSFAPKLYPYIDHGWATTIHKTQGVTVDHVKKLATAGEYRNLSYVGMTRHRESLQVFGLRYHFPEAEMLSQKQSRIQEKLSGLDYRDATSLQAQMNQDRKILWHERKWEESKNLWFAVKETGKSFLDQALGRTSAVKPSAEASQFRSDSEEMRSQAIFKIRETLPDARANFERNNRNKYRGAVEFFEFPERFGRAPTPIDQPMLEIMADNLTTLAGNIFEKQALADNKFQIFSEVSGKAYKEFALQHAKEQGLADHFVKTHGMYEEAAKAVAAVLTSHQINPTSSEATKLTDYAQSRHAEITSDHAKDLTTFRLSHELREIAKHPDKTAVLNTPEKLKVIQEAAKIETKKLEMKMQEDLIIQQQQQSMRQGMRL